jgi:hypothetical protein
MDGKTIGLLFGTWFLLMILAILNAGVRNAVFKPVVGELRAHQLSTLTFIMIIVVVTYLSFRLSNLQLTGVQAILFGTTWLFLTISFEFLAGHYVFGNSWEMLMSDYNILLGRIWVIVLITLFFTPYLMKKLLEIG